MSNKDFLHFSTLEAYCQGIQISPPKNNLYDIRSFEENMKTVRHQMPYFKHEFFAIALKLEGDGFAAVGNYDTKALKATIFFNSPYQITYWDIAPNWKGFYIIFTEEFYQRMSPNKRITERFPFLLSDNAFPLVPSESESAILYKVFSSLHLEHQNRQLHQEEIILYYLNILLLKTAQLYYESPFVGKFSTQQRENDLHILARFQTLLETSFYPHQNYVDESPHQVQFYAERMNLHPNHLNALVKRITKYSASDLIQNHVIALAKSKLKHSSLSVKEIAYNLYFNYPNHFSTFFKKQVGQSPNAYRN